MIQGQVNLRDAVRKTISFTQGSKSYRLKDKTATLFVRPRGLHLDEAHVTVGGQAVAGGLFDLAVYLAHNAVALLAQGSGPYLYIPKIEYSKEARWWNDAFCLMQDFLGLPRGTIRATALLETITAAFELEEILYEMKDHSLGLNCGRWDYVFSYIKRLKAHPEFVTPDRGHLTMTSPFMQAYVLFWSLPIHLLIHSFVQSTHLLALFPNTVMCLLSSTPATNAGPLPWVVWRLKSL